MSCRRAAASPRSTSPSQTATPLSRCRCQGVGGAAQAIEEVWVLLMAWTVTVQVAPR